MCCDVCCAAVIKPLIYSRAINPTQTPSKPRVWGQQGVANELGGPGDALAQKQAIP